MRNTLAGICCAAVIGIQHPAAAQAPSSAHGHGHDHQLLSRGEQEMGFDQVRTSHHFRLSPQGGNIEVHVNNVEDRELRDRVIRHLRQISIAFARGDFSTPFAVHAEDPPGVSGLKALGREIRYTFEEGELGGRVWISTRNRRALAAIHDFLRYQIREHRTGDPTSYSSHCELK